MVGKQFQPIYCISPYLEETSSDKSWTAVSYLYSFIHVLLSQWIGKSRAAILSCGCWNSSSDHWSYYYLKSSLLIVIMCKAPMTLKENYCISFLNLLSMNCVPQALVHVLENKTDKTPYFSGVYFLVYLPHNFIMQILLFPFSLQRK